MTHNYGNMVCSMKTTIELPDELLIAAKKRAAEIRRPLRSLIEEGLRWRLALRDRPKPARSRTIRWVTVKGGLPADLDITDREKMHDWLRDRS
jgi:hypothetical protein